LLAARDAERELALGALRAALDGVGSGYCPLGPPIVAGRIPPDDWRPDGPGEARECWTLTVGFLRQVTRSDNPALHDGGLGATTDHLGRLLLNGSLADFQSLLVPDALTDTRLSRLLGELDRFLTQYGSSGAGQVSPELEVAIREWRQRLVPGTLHGRLVSLVG